MSSGRVEYGHATVWWGPRTYGRDRVVANCSVEHVEDLLTAVSLAAKQMKEDPAYIKGETRETETL